MCELLPNLSFNHLQQLTFHEMTFRWSIIRKQDGGACLLHACILRIRELCKFGGDVFLHVGADGWQTSLV